jgi:hypothetical protein
MSEQWPPEPVTKRKGPPPVAGLPVALPDLSGGALGESSRTPNVQPSTRARVDRGARPRRPTPRDAASLPPWLAKTGAAGYWLGRPPSLSQVWWLHCRSADWLSGIPALKWARYCWGGFHVALLVMTYTLAWATGTVPRVLMLAALIALAVVLL